MKSTHYIILSMFLVTSLPASQAELPEEATWGLILGADGTPAQGALVAPSDYGLTEAGEPLLVPNWDRAVVTGTDGTYYLTGTAPDSALLVKSADGEETGAIHHIRVGKQPDLILEASNDTPTWDKEYAEKQLPVRESIAAHPLEPAKELQPIALIQTELIDELKETIKDVTSTSAAPVDPLETPLVTLYVNSIGRLWPVLVPFPADFNGDLLIDGTLTADVNLNTGELCLLVDYVHTVGNRNGFNFGVGHSDTVVLFESSYIPNSIDACAEPGSGSSYIDWTASSSSGDLQAYLLGNGIDFRMSLDQMPRYVQVEISEPSWGDGIAINYNADRSLYFLFNFFTASDDIIGHVDRIPRSFQGEFNIDQYTLAGIEHTWIEVDYWAWSSINEIIVAYNYLSGDPLQVEVRGIPTSLHAYFNVQKDAGTVNYVRYQHTASGGISEILVAGQVGAYPIYVYAASLPATVNKSYFSQSESGRTSRTTVKWDSSSSIRDLLIIIGDSTTANYFGVSVPIVPAQLDAYFESISDGADLDRMWYYHSTSSALPSIIVVADMDYGDMEFYLELTDLPTYSLATLEMNRDSDDKVFPTLYFDATNAGLDILYSLEGRTLGVGGYFYAQIDNLPTKFRTTVYDNWYNHMRVDVNTGGSGSVDLLYIDAYLPLAMANKKTDRFYIYFEDLVHFEIEIKSLLLRCIDMDLLAIICMKWNDRDASYGLIYHSDLVINKWDWLTIAPGPMEYHHQEQTWGWRGLEYCYCYHTRYISLTDDLAIYIPSYFGSGNHVRALGY